MKAMYCFSNVFVVTILIGYFVFQPVKAVPANSDPFEETQPDGTKIVLYVHGDENFNYVTDSNGYAVVRRGDGTFVYATQQNQDGTLVAEGQYIVGETDPIRIGISQNKIQRLRNYDDKDCTTRSCRHDPIYQPSPLSPSVSTSSPLSSLRGSRNTNLDDVYRRPSPRRPTKNNSSRDNINDHRGTTTATKTTGKLKNLVIPMLWADHYTRPLPHRDYIDILFNNEGPDYHCPSGSVRDYYRENSGGQLILESTVVNWVPMDYSELFYSGGQSGRWILIHDAIRYALRYLDWNNIVKFSDFDVDNDGKIDAITFLHSGYDANWGGSDAYGQYFTNRIWPHKWELYTGAFYSSDGVEVYNYHITSAMFGLFGYDTLRLPTVTHETGHFLGLPDLYDSDGGGNGLGYHALMAASSGFGIGHLYPSHFSAWSKIKLGWITPVKPQEGINMISATESQLPNHPQIYKIDAGFPKGEYLLIENRQPMGFDSKIPQGGLMIYHIDDNVGYDNEGYPGQPGWPENGNHYRVSIIQADGLYDLERGINNGDGGDVFHGDGVNEVGPSKQISARWPYPNTDSYNTNKFYVAKVYISDISISGEDMSFRYHVGGVPTN